MIILFGYLKRLVAFIFAIFSILGIKTNTVTVELYTNPSSGYTWEYSFDKSGILTLDDATYSPDASSIITGKGGGTQFFTFKSLGTGTVNVTFEYAKTENNKKQVISTYVYNYTVSENGVITLNSIN